MNQSIEHERYRNVSGGSIIINDINPNWEIPDGAVLNVVLLPEELVRKSHDLRRLIAKNFLIPDGTTTPAAEPPVQASVQTVSEDMVDDIASRVSDRLLSLLTDLVASGKVQPQKGSEIKDLSSSYEDLVAEHRAEVIEEILKTKFPAQKIGISSTEAVEASENVTSDIKSSLRGLRQDTER